MSRYFTSSVQLFRCGVGDVPDDAEEGALDKVKRVRKIARRINTSIMKQSNDRDYRFAHEGIRGTAAMDWKPGMVRAGDTMAVAFVVGTHQIHFLVSNFSQLNQCHQCRFAGTTGQST